MTEKLFYNDTHMTEFNATVLECTPADGVFYIELDRTAFFPEEGGQNADSGTLAGQPVLDVQIKEDIITHTLSAPLEVGTKVSGCVNWKKRFDYMQQHSGEHLISGLVHQAFGYDNVGFHLGDEEVTLDFNGLLTLEELREIEKKANQAIFENFPVWISFPSKEELDILNYRSKKELTGDIRIVEFPGYDICACCAPHVDTTGQIGLIKVTGVMKHRGGVRVNILCGNRALLDYTEKQDNVSAISVLLSAKPESVAEAVTRLKEENRAQRERLISLQATLLQSQIEALSPDLKNVLLFMEDLDTPAMRNAVNSLTEKYAGYCAIFVGNDEDGYRYILGSSTLDCKEAANLLSQSFGAKGGGSSQMIQGSLNATRSDLLSLFS